MRFIGSNENLVLGGIVGGLTFVAIFLIGLVSGVSLGLLFVRGVFYGILLALLGTGLGILLERLVPGVWTSDGAGGPGADDAPGGDGSPEHTFEYTVGADDDAGAAEPGKAYADYASSFGVADDGAADDADGESPSAPAARGQHVPRSVAGESKVVGNVRIIDDKQFPNDPEDYAKAIRTMMSRDDG